jgi:hypothetical protein
MKVFDRNATGCLSPLMSVEQELLQMRILMCLTLFGRVWSDLASLRQVPARIVPLEFQRLLGINCSSQTSCPFIISYLMEVLVH